MTMQCEVCLYHSVSTAKAGGTALQTLRELWKGPQSLQHAAQLLLAEVHSFLHDHAPSGLGQYLRDWRRTQ